VKTPWKTVQPIDADREYIGVVTELVPKSMRSTGRLFRGARRSSVQIARSEGIVGFATLAQPVRKRYQTISLWETDADVDAFARSGDHHELVRDLAPELATVKNTRWRVPGRDGRPDWKQAQELLRRCRT
jgi:hypothetical protein